MATHIIDKITDLLGNVFKFKDNSGDASSHTHSIANVTGLQTALNGKQDTISDIATIRSNAANGQTAYGWGNHADAGYATSAQMWENDEALQRYCETLDSNKANKDGSNASGTWSNITAGKALGVLGAVGSNVSHIFTTPTEWGASAGDTPASIWNSMPNYSMLYCSAGTLTNSGWSFPYSSGIAILVKYTSVARGFIVCLQKDAGGIAKLPLGGSDGNTPTLPWKYQLNSNGAIGSSTQPVYVNSSGQVTACGADKISNSNNLTLDVNSVNTFLTDLTNEDITIVVPSASIHKDTIYSISSIDNTTTTARFVKISFAADSTGNMLYRWGQYSASYKKASVVVYVSRGHTCRFVRMSSNNNIYVIGY